MASSSYAHLTSMRSGGEQVDLDLPEFDSCAGIYKVHDVNPVLGHSEYTDHSVVAMHADKDISHWFSGSTIGDAYEQCRQESWKENLLKSEGAIAERMRSGDLTHQQWTNLFQRGQTEVSYFSGSIPKRDMNLVHISPLLGYVSANSDKSTLPSNMFSHKNIIDVSNLGQSGQRRIWETCTWDSEQLQNPYVMQHPLVGWKGVISGEHYEMSGAHFSTCSSVVDLFSPGAMVRMTPDSKSEYEGASDQVRLRVTDELLGHLMKSRDSLNLLSSDVYDGEYLTLDRKPLVQAIEGSTFAFAS